MNARGKAGEDVALAFLAAKGFTLLQRNYTSRYGEIDLILTNADYLIFVEVKARGARSLDTPGASVTVAKQRKIIKTALMYLSEHAMTRQPRFDVVEVLGEWGSGAREPEIRHIENAFWADGAVF